MRISDWSSDVCSSDLQRAQLDNRLSLPDGPQGFPERGPAPREGRLNFRSAPRFPRRDRDQPKAVSVGRRTFAIPSKQAMEGLMDVTYSARKPVTGSFWMKLMLLQVRRIDRSEAHTSEIQSLMSNSYAVF